MTGFKRTHFHPQDGPPLPVPYLCQTLSDCLTAPRPLHPILTGHVDLSLTHQPGHGSPFYTHRYHTPPPARTVRGQLFEIAQRAIGVSLHYGRGVSRHSPLLKTNTGVSPRPSLLRGNRRVSLHSSLPRVHTSVSTLPRDFKDQQEGARTHQNLASGAAASRQLRALVDPLYHRFPMKEG